MQVYRNLNRGGYSVRQDGLVVAHTDGLILTDCSFIVREPGRSRALITGVRNVHAWVEGTIRRKSDTLEPLRRIRYTLQDGAFRVKGIGPALRSADTVILCEFGVFAAGVD